MFFIFYLQVKYSYMMCSDGTNLVTSTYDELYPIHITVEETDLYTRGHNRVVVTVWCSRIRALRMNQQ
jgi:hypothetical protein